MTMEPEITINRLLRPEDAREAYCCMTEVPTPWPESLSQCRDWVADNLGQHIEGYHAVTGEGEIVGQLYFAPSERALVAYRLEPGAAVIYCEWVQQRHQGQGLGRRLFQAFQADMVAEGCKGIVIEATDLEDQAAAAPHYRHYVDRGFRVILQAGTRLLLYLPLAQASITATPLEPQVRIRQGLPVEITLLHGYMCPFEVSTQLLLREVVREFSRRVVLREEWLSPDTLQHYGAAGGIFINGRRSLSGAVSEHAIRQAIIDEL